MIGRGMKERKNVLMVRMREYFRAKRVSVCVCERMFERGERERIFERGVSERESEKVSVFEE